jgi:hypothetical protein
MGEQEKRYTMIAPENGRVIMEHVTLKQIDYYKKWYATLTEIKIEEELDENEKV